VVDGSELDDELLKPTQGTAAASFVESGANKTPDE